MSDDGSSGAGLTDPAGADAAVDPCAASYSDERFGLRIGGIFIILVTSLVGTLAPILLRQSSFIPRPVFEFAKFFGSGVIIATAFIHLLAPAFEELGSECLSGAWTDYSWAPALAMAAVYGIFFAEVAAYRIGSRKLAALGVQYNTHSGEPSDAHAHDHGRHVPLDVPTHGDEAQGHVHPQAAARLAHPDSPTSSNTPTGRDLEKSLAGSHGQGMEGEVAPMADHDSDGASSHMPSRAEASAQLIGVAVLEFGVILHSVIIGLTLSVNEDFITLFIVIIFHQMFEGLGLGSRLSALYLPRQLRWARYAAAVLYSICTPVGMAVGLGVRTTYNGNGVEANIASGVLDSLSAGILLYTGLVELMAHEIVLNPRMMKSSTGKLAYIFICMLLGSGLMALLGRWA